MPDLEFRGISKSFADGTVGVHDVSFTAPAGRLTTLVGPSGSGKSTLLRIAAGLESATSGGVYQGGLDLGKRLLKDRNITLLFPTDSLFPHLDVIDNVGFGLKHQGISAEQTKARSQHALALVGLRDLEHRSCTDLSGGQLQRVALARALVIEPATLLLDESLSNLDDHLRRQLRDDLRTLQRQLGTTIVYVTHDQREAMAVSDHMVVLRDGRLQQQGSPREVYETPASEFVASFMGDAAMFDITAGQDGSLCLGPLPLPAGGKTCAPGERVQVMVRPEAWQVYAPGERPGMPGRIVHAAYLGHAMEYLIDTPLGELLVLCPHARARRRPNAPVSLALGQRGFTLLKTRS